MTNFGKMTINRTINPNLPIARWLLIFCLFTSIFTFTGVVGQFSQRQQKAATELVLSNEVTVFYRIADFRIPAGRSQGVFSDQGLIYRNAVIVFGRLIKVKFDNQSHLSVIITTFFHLHHAQKIPRVLSDDTFASFLG